MVIKINQAKWSLNGGEQAYFNLYKIKKSTFYLFKLTILFKKIKAELQKKFKLCKDNYS